MVQAEGRYVDTKNVNTAGRHSEVIENLRNVYDPEISINIYDLGLIYTVDIDDTDCKIKMSLTSPFCPAADEIIEDVHLAALSVNGISTVDVNITFDPPWGPELMSDEAKLTLGLF